MKKTTKYLMLTFLFLIIIVALFYIFLSQQKEQEKALNESVIYVPTSTKEIVDPKIMTKEERETLKVDQTLNIEVIRRNASGTPTDYRVIK